MNESLQQTDKTGKYYTARMNSVPWIFTVLLWLAWTSYTNGFMFDIIRITMEPNKDKMVAVNETIIISCKDTANKGISLFKNNSLVESNNTSYIKYQLTSDKPNVYIFTCRNFHMQNRVKITFRYPPVVTSARAKISAINNTTCYMVVNFTLAHFRNLDYIKILRFAKGEGSTFCSNNNVCKFQCFLYFDYVFNVQLAASDLPMYSKNWTFTSDETIYKLGKLTKLELPEVRSESLKLSYGVTNNLDELFINPFVCLYRIFYKSEWDETVKNFTTNKTDVVLENLVPYTTYTIDIQARINESIYWSDKLTRKKRTLPSAPYAGPKSTNGSYLETPCKEKYKRCFILYWAMIPKPLRNGILESFIIQQNGTVLSETSEIFAQINDQPQNKDLWFGIRAKTNDSQYSPPTIIHIPPKAPERPRAVTVVKLNSTHFSISWILKQSWENKTVTVMSCFGEKAGSIFSCKSDVMWTKIQNKNSTILKAPKATDFAVSISNSEGSSSLTFAKCLLGGGRAKTPPKPVIFKRSPYKMNLQWPLFDCNELNGRPTLFQVLYAEGNSCRNGLELNISAIGIKPETEISEIKNLKPFTRYSVCFRIRTEEGWSQIGPHVIAATDETNPGSVRNLQVTNITSGSITLKWDPTLQPNGIITKYIVTYFKLGDSTHEILSSYSNMANVSSLSPYSKYNFTVSTCNKAGCSKGRYAIAKTLIGNTAVVDLELTVNKSILIINWKPPSFMKEHVLYYNIKIIYNTQEHIQNVTDTKYSLSFSCESDLIFERVNVTAVIKNGSSMIYGDPRTGSQNLCQKNEKNWVYILLGIFFFVMIIGLIVWFIKWIHKNAKKTKIPARFPEVEKDSYNYPFENNKDDSSVSVVSDSDSQTNLIPQMNSENERILQAKNNNTNNNNSGEKLEMSSIPVNIRQKEDPRQRNLPQVIFNQINQDSNGYMINDVNTSKVNEDNSDSNHQGAENIASSHLNLVNLDSKDNGQDLSERNQPNSDFIVNLDSNGYACNEMKSPELSQVSSDSNYVQNNINSSELSQPNSSSIALSKLNSANLDSNGYACNEMKSPELGQFNSDSDNYVQKNINSSELSKVNSDSDNYVQNNINSSELSQVNSDSDKYVQNNINSSELSQVNSDSDKYVQNNINSSELCQTTSDSIALSKLNSANLDSNGYVCDEVNPSELSKANSDGFVHNVNGNELSLVNSDSDNYVQNYMNSSNSNSNGSVCDNVNILELNQIKSRSKKYRDKNPASSELSPDYAILISTNIR